MNPMDKSVCCPPFDPRLWDGKVLIWNNKKFIQDKVFTLFHIPMNFGGVMNRLMKKVEDARAKVPDYLCLSEHTSKWNMAIYLAVDRELPDAENVKMSGRFLSRVYEGPFKDTGKWVRDFGADATKRGLGIKKMFMWYTTCPKCAKKYGKNYVVIVGQVG